jgi:hypothetical protein
MEATNQTICRKRLEIEWKRPIRPSVEKGWCGARVFQRFWISGIG